MYLTTDKFYQVCRAVESSWDDMVKDSPDRTSLKNRISRLTGFKMDDKKLAKILKAIGKTPPTQPHVSTWTKRIVLLGKELEKIAEQGGLELSEEFRETFR